MINSKNNTSFSSLYRSKHLQLMETEEFDLVVIGGGITGCGIALDAASRGMKVALLEKNDFASGTSSKSTKLDCPTITLAISDFASLMVW